MDRSFLCKRIIKNDLLHKHSSFYILLLAQSAGAVEYADSIFAEG